MNVIKRRKKMLGNPRDSVQRWRRVRLENKGECLEKSWKNPKKIYKKSLRYKMISVILIELV